jgi:hypothetical protein
MIFVSKKNAFCRKSQKIALIALAPGQMSCLFFPGSSFPIGSFVSPPTWLATWVLPLSRKQSQPPTLGVLSTPTHWRRGSEARLRLRNRRSAVRIPPAANPTVLSYHASAVIIYNATIDISCFLKYVHKQKYFTLKNALVYYNAGVVPT